MTREKLGEIKARVEACTGGREWEDLPALLEEIERGWQEIERLTAELETVRREAAGERARAERYRGEVEAVRERDAAVRAKIDAELAEIDARIAGQEIVERPLTPGRTRELDPDAAQAWRRDEIAAVLRCLDEGPPPPRAGDLVAEQEEQLRAFYRRAANALRLSEAARAQANASLNSITDELLAAWERAAEVREKAVPEEERPRPGLYRKYRVERTDGSSGPGGKHEHCDYLVLDWQHDPFAIHAGAAYADACETTRPELAADIRARVAKLRAQFVRPALIAESEDEWRVRRPASSATDREALGRLVRLAPTVVSFLRENFRDDGAEGESVHRACDIINALVNRPAPLTEAPTECTGFSASWCPVHGDCRCPDIHGTPDNGRTFDDPGCPLHGEKSTHGEEPDAPLTLRTSAEIAGGDDATITAEHTITLDGNVATVGERWTDTSGEAINSYEVTMPFSQLVHLALNTTAEERAAIDARADWRGVDPEPGPSDGPGARRDFERRVKAGLRSGAAAGMRARLDAMGVPRPSRCAPDMAFPRTGEHKAAINEETHTVDLGCARPVHAGSETTCPLCHSSEPWTPTSGARVRTADTRDQPSWPVCVDCATDPGMPRTEVVSEAGACARCGNGGVMYAPAEPWTPTPGARVRLVRKIACLTPVGSEGVIPMSWEATEKRPAEYCVDCPGYPAFVTDASNLEPVTPDPTEPAPRIDAQERPS